jgi:hypothetical protein
MSFHGLLLICSITDLIIFCRLEKYTREYVNIKNKHPTLPPECTFQPPPPPGVAPGASRSSKHKDKSISDSNSNAKSGRDAFFQRMQNQEQARLAKLEQLRASAASALQSSKIGSGADRDQFMKRLEEDLANRQALERSREQESQRKSASMTFKPQLFGKNRAPPGTIDDFLGRLGNDLANRERKWKLRDHVFGLDEPENGKKSKKKKPTFKQLQASISKLYQKD